MVQPGTRKSSFPAATGAHSPATDQTPALLPCPHCGEAEELYLALHGMGGGKPYAIDCLGCGADFVPREGMDVVATWNRRAGDPR